MSADKLTELPNSAAVYRKVYGGAVYIGNAEGGDAGAAEGA